MDELGGTDVGMNALRNEFDCFLAMAHEAHSVYTFYQACSVGMNFCIHASYTAVQYKREPILSSDRQPTVRHCGQRPSSAQRPQC